MKSILLVYGSGGHNEQMQRLYTELQISIKKHDIESRFISFCDHDVKHPVTNKVYYTTSVTDKFSYIKIALKLIPTFIKTVQVIRGIDKEHNIAYMISTGPGIAILTALYFKLKRKKIIHIETWSRFYSKSLTGRFMYYLADEFIIQNKELFQLYPKAVYKGRL
jgi:UDP-N-acetylglucosamine:LPS N-acetylglucosamine transferase